MQFCRVWLCTEGESTVLIVINEPSCSHPCTGLYKPRFVRTCFASVIVWGFRRKWGGAVLPHNFKNVYACGFTECFAITSK